MAPPHAAISFALLPGTLRRAVRPGNRAPTHVQSSRVTPRSSQPVVTDLKQGGFGASGPGSPHSTSGHSTAPAEPRPDTSRQRRRAAERERCHEARRTAASLRDAAPIASAQPLLGPHGPAAALGSNELGRSGSSVSHHLTANEDGAEGRESKPSSQGLCDLFALMRPAQLRKRLGVLFWSEKRSIVPHRHRQKPLTAKPKEPQLLRRFPLRTALSPRAGAGDTQPEREGTFRMANPINKPTSIHGKRFCSFH